MTVLVVGGTGFLGSHIVDALISAGRSVRVLAPHPELYRSPNPLVEHHFGRLELGSELDRALDGCRVVIDVGSSAVPASAQQSPAATASSSLGATCWLAERCIAAGVEHLLFISSGGTVYESSDSMRLHSEGDAVAPRSVYGSVKASTELVLAAVLRNSIVRYTCLRVSNAYGERQNPARPQGIVSVGFTRLKAGLALDLVDRGRVIRDFIYAGDVASLVLLVIENRAEGVYNAGTGVGVSIASLLADMERIAGRRFTFRHLPARPFDAPHAVLDIGRVQALGWAPHTTLEEGLARTWGWMLDPAT